MRENARGLEERDVPTSQTWDPERYARNARFVADLGMPVVDLLDPKPGERILDLGCGDGALTEKLVALGCQVVGVDGSAEQITAAREWGLEAYVMDGQTLTFVNEFDAVFSNAVLHWMKRADDVVGGVWRALKPGGRFIAECGGFGNITKITTVLYAVLHKYGVDGDAVNPWYFATPEQYAQHLTARGFHVTSIALIPRPTRLPGDITGWLETFAESFLSAVSSPDRPAVVDEVRELLQPELCDASGQWTADYVRLRFAAVKPVGSSQ
jgi:SAM-dependent methyltransferase